MSERKTGSETDGEGDRYKDRQIVRETHIIVDRQTGKKRDD